MVDDAATVLVAVVVFVVSVVVVFVVVVVVVVEAVGVLANRRYVLSLTMKVPEKCSADFVGNF